MAVYGLVTKDYSFNTIWKKESGSEEKCIHTIDYSDLEHTTWKRVGIRFHSNLLKGFGHAFEEVTK